MGLFDKKEKLDFDKASGIMFMLSITLQDQAMIIKNELGLERNHVVAVNTGYVLGISLLFITSQIGLKRVNEFIRSSIKNAKATLLPEMQILIPDIQKYCETAKNFVLMEATDVDRGILFEELTKKYLNDLCEGRNYSSELFELAKNDLIFYFKQTDEFVKNIKIK